MAPFRGGAMTASRREGGAGVGARGSRRGVAGWGSLGDELELLSSLCAEQSRAFHCSMPKSDLAATPPTSLTDDD